jgi:3-oxoacyl-[acyl-carrier protein] reductase
MERTQRRVAIVTGAARGIGAATASRLARDGARVALVDIRAQACEEVAAKIAAAGGSAAVFPADVASPAEVSRAVGDVAAALGPPSVLVNNAGVVRDRPIGEMTDDDWETVINVNLRGSFNMCRAVQSYLVAHRWGRIVNLSSGSARGNRGQANYSSAKAGILGLTRTLAFELGKYNVTVNAIAPGYIVTDMTAETAHRMGADFSKLQRAVANQTPIRRVGYPEDIAATVAFLASDDAGFVTGQVIGVDGGLSH